MEIPEHIRAELAKLIMLISHHEAILAGLKQEQAKLVHAATGVNVLAEDASLDVNTWKLERANDAGH